jgi:transposase
MPYVARLGIDLSKNVFHAVGVDALGREVLRKSFNRLQLRQFLATLPPCMVAMESCATAFHWARYARQRGHEIRIIASQFVKPYVKGNKNDFNDAQAICEAAGRPSMRFVPVKSVEQQDVQALHRVRQRRMEERTALMNQIRGILLEYGVPVRLGPSALRRAIPEILEDGSSELSGQGRAILHALQEEWMQLELRIKEVERELHRVYRASDSCQRLGEIDGVGPLTATALVAAVGNGADFKNGRHMAAWLGLVPRQHSSGGRDRLLGISKRGDRYLRSLLIHGARSVMKIAEKRSDRRCRWASALEQRRGHNVATVALANKNARVAWAILAHGDRFRREVAMS